MTDLEEAIVEKINKVKELSIKMEYMPHPIVLRGDLSAMYTELVSRITTGQKWCALDHGGQQHLINLSQVNHVQIQSVDAA